MLGKEPESLWEYFLNLACQQAEQAGKAGDIPVGAIIIRPQSPSGGEHFIPPSEWEILAQAGNTREQGDPCGHAEINAIRQASAKLGTWNLSECTLVVTLEPCAMCTGAIINTRIKRVVFGAWEEKTGCCGSRYDLLRDQLLGSEVEVIAGIAPQRCQAQLQDFFTQLRQTQTP